ncbi:hypothetical protein Salat_1258800 [Sesamum alatum]|uniref:Uncharacterized protein n=1 Tax=Sesamum alatum TaxID=300844 RepID=A0AAE1YGH5_9LAMI|nr:hypothetical protein Salat_1258800 [Sesamum alatum]
MSSVTPKFITATSVFLPSLDHAKPFRRFQVRISLISSSNYANSDQSVCWGNRSRKDEKSRRRFHVYNVVQPGAPPPSEPPFYLISWILGVAITTVEEIVEAVEKVAEGVEKVAEDIADDLPEGGRLRKAVDFVESVAERASKDAHLVGDFIDKVQEVEERVEEYVESFSTTHDHDHDHDDDHHHPKEEEEKGHEPSDQENSDNYT